MDHPLSFQVKLAGSFDSVIEKVSAALKTEGFGVLTQIDVKATLKKKMNEDFRPYVILGACNPPLAHRALSVAPEVGGMLPCNVTVDQLDDGVLVSIVNPEAMLGVPPLNENAELVAVATEARTRLERVKVALES